MSYANEFLAEFTPVYFGILQAKQILPGHARVEIIDEDDRSAQQFQMQDCRSVLEQIGAELNDVTIYTERPAYFRVFAEKMYEENGLIVKTISKRYMLRRKDATRHPVKNTILFDFEWQGKCYDGQIRLGKHYIPIYKKPWEKAANLDIVVPIGYNTVIVKRQGNIRKKPYRDRFEAAFFQ